MIFDSVGARRRNLAAAATAEVNGHHLPITTRQVLGHKGERGEIGRQAVDAQQQWCTIGAPPARPDGSSRSKFTEPTLRGPVGRASPRSDSAISSGHVPAQLEEPASVILAALTDEEKARVSEQGEHVREVLTG